MIQIYPDEGLVKLLKRMATSSLDYRLFTNNVTITRSTGIAGITELTTFGYALITVVLGDFTTTGVTAHVGSLIAAPISWTPAGGSWTLYGYYVTANDTGELLYAGNFDSAPITVPNGTPLLLTPRIGDFSQLGA